MLKGETSNTYMGCPMTNDNAKKVKDETPDESTSTQKLKAARAAAGQGEYVLARTILMSMPKKPIAKARPQPIKLKRRKA